MFFVMAMPRPVPGTPEDVALSSRANDSKMCSWNSGVIPMPVSRTMKW